MPGLYIVGDSQAGGLAPYFESATVDSRVGWTTARYADDPPAVENADVILVVLGTNDYWQTDEQIRTATAAMISALRLAAPAARIVWIGPPACSRKDLAARLPKVARLQAEICAGAGVEWWDSQPWTGYEQASDGTHYTAAGYNAWSQGIKAGPLASGGSLLLIVAALAGVLWLLR